MSCSKALIDDGCDFVQVGEIEGHVGADRKPYPVCEQRDASDEIEDGRGIGFAAGNAVVYGDLKDIEIFQVLAGPNTDGRTVSDADRGTLSRTRHFTDPNLHP